MSIVKFKTFKEDNETVENILYHKLVNDSNGIMGNNYEFEINDFENDWEVMKRTKDNYAWRLLKSDRPVLKHLIIFLKKVIRRCLKWYIEPVCNQQTEFNNAIMNYLGEIKEERDEIVKQFDYIKGQYADVNEMLDRIKQYDFYSKGNPVKLSYSQSGEDSIISYIFTALQKPLQEVTYLDLGANHAKELSNTYFLYLNSARGVLVEANPALIPELKLIRGEDTVVNRCIATEDGISKEFFVFNGDGLSTSNFDSAKEMEKINPYVKIDETIVVPSITISTLLDQYFTKAPDLINLDIEGVELEILQQFDFEKYRPLIFVVETIPYKPTIVYEEKRKDILEFFANKNYVEYAFTGINSLFVNREKLEEISR